MFCIRSLVKLTRSSLLYSVFYFCLHKIPGLFSYHLASFVVQQEQVVTNLWAWSGVQSWRSDSSRGLTNGAGGPCGRLWLLLQHVSASPAEENMVMALHGSMFNKFHCLVRAKATIGFNIFAACSRMKRSTGSFYMQAAYDSLFSVSQSSNCCSTRTNISICSV